MNGWKILYKTMNIAEIVGICSVVLLLLLITAIPGFIIGLIMSCFIWPGTKPFPTEVYYVLTSTSLLSIICCVIICCVITFLMIENGGWEPTRLKFIKKAEETELIKANKKLNKGGEVSVASPINGALSRPEMGGEV